MNRIAFRIITLCFFIIPLFSVAQGLFDGYEHLFTPVRNYVVCQTTSSMDIDGKADEPAWEQAAWTADFVDIEAGQKPVPAHRTRVKMLWDKQNLYVLAELEESQIWAYYTDHDQVVYHENDIEVFIDPDGNAHDYFEFEVNARNTVFDLFLPKPYRNGGSPLVSWNGNGFKSAVSVDGTVNDPTDVDRKWTVEMIIPFETVKTGENSQVPKDGQVWRIDFSRVQWQTDVVDGVYQKRKDEKTGRYLSEHNWVWSAPGLINMHYPERWGLLQFSESSVDSEKISFQMPKDEVFKKYLWLIYYKQQDFKRAHGTYATALSELQIQEVIKTVSGQSVQLNLMATKFQFTIMLSTEMGLVMSVNENGLFRNSHQ